MIQEQNGSLRPKAELKSVKIAREGSSLTKSSVSPTSPERNVGRYTRRCRDFFAKHSEWIGKNWTWSKIKPVIRCAVVGWISVVIFVIPKVEAFVGQASFMILIAAFLSPPSDPFISVLEREIIILLFVTIAWAWVCLGLFLANLARRVRNPTASLLDVASGIYIEAAPTVIMAVFIFFGSAFYLYIKARQGPGPYLFASVFSCICIVISLTTSVLFPFPNYMIGRVIVLPLTLHSALSLLASLLIFPSTISAQFTTRLQGVLTPLISAIDIHRDLLSIPLPPTSLAPSSSASDPEVDEYTKKINSAITSIKACEAALIPLAASARLLKSDLIYARFAPPDFRVFHRTCKRLAGRANGLGGFFALVGVGPFAGVGIGTGGQNTPAPSTSGTPAHTVPNTPGTWSPAPGSRGTSPERGTKERKPSTGDALRDETQHLSKTPTAASAPQPPHSPTRSIRTHARASSSSSANPKTHSHHAHHHDHHHLLQKSLLSLASRSSFRNAHDQARRRREPEHAVGTFESQRYLNLEATRLWDPHREEWTRRAMGLLGKSCDPVLAACHDGLSCVNSWLGTVRNGRFRWWLGRGREERQKVIKLKINEVKDMREKVSRALEDFRNETRHLVLEPYSPAFNGEKVNPDEPSYTGGSNADLNHQETDKSLDPEKYDIGDDEEEVYKMPPHRYLFHCYVYQYHLIQICSIVIEMLDEIIELEEKRVHHKLWTPVERLFQWNRSSVVDSEHHPDDDDPNTIQGLRRDIDSDSMYSDDLGMPRRRDPDALPPRNFVEWVMTLLYEFIVSFGRGNVLFALKAGLFTVALSMPSFFKSSAPFAYANKFVWGIFMGQLTLARFRGDTAFGLVARVMSTFFGGLTGMVMWYVSCGNGRGNAYGLAAVCGVCFPFFYFARLYAPIPPMTNIVFFVTACLVIGYSYQDVNIVVPGSPGFGWDVAWRRFVLVTAGVVAAGIVSFFPPSTTIRKYHRNLMATTSTELGSIYCSILSFANSKHEPEIQQIISSLIAIRSKLDRSAVLRTNVIYEFSLRGRWPAKRYQQIVDLQTAISYSLSHLMSVVKHLESNWARAFLRRTRFMDSDFQGDILAVISMISSSLRTGSPLPQITPCPLLDRFMLKYHGLDVIHKDAEENYGLPRTLTLDTLKDEQYLMFCVGITTAFSIINRLDRLMLATKEIVGEQYHIHGVGILPVTKGVEMDVRRVTTFAVQPPNLRNV
ncbi:hypothetical protein B0H34DRAFT_735166 [Crassisporium funariophilum]|nr:hypothetical protein B0H34DRAFT_735166 [Crassisporium funariophilum]